MSDKILFAVITFCFIIGAFNLDYPKIFLSIHQHSADFSLSVKFADRKIAVLFLWHVQHRSVVGLNVE